MRVLIEPRNVTSPRLLRGAYEDFASKGPWGKAIATDIAGYLSLDIGLAATDVSEAHAWFAAERTRAYSSNPAGWTVAAV